MHSKLTIFALSLLWCVSMPFESLGAGVFRIVMRDGSEFIGAVRSFEDGMYGLVLPSGDRSVAAADVRRIDVVRADPAQGDGRAQQRGPVPVVPEFQLLVGKSGFVVGRMRSFEDGIYEIETRFGPVTVPAADVAKIDLSWMSAADADRRTAAASADLAANLTEGLIRFAGSNVIGETLVPALLEGYATNGRALSTLWVSGATAQEQSFVAVAPDGRKFVASINRRGTASALDALAGGSADLGMMSRQVSPEESPRLAGAGSGNPPAKVQGHLVALGGAVVLVHQSNPIKALHLDRIADIFSGRVRNWAEVGGPSRRIRLVAPPEGSGILDVFRARVLRGQAISPLTARISSSTELSGLVGSDPTAIGVTEFAYVRNAAALAIMDECGLSHAPSEFSIQTEEYPLSSHLYLYTKSGANAEVQRFVSFALSTAGQDHLREHGHVSLSPILASQGMPLQRTGVTGADPAGQRIVTQLMTFLETARRLSVTFRFVAASLDLDTRGLADLDRLAEYLRGDARQGRRVALLGFSDRTGTVASNVQLAEKRARLVAQKLKGKGATVDRVFGFGPLLPVACDTAPVGRASNRRVEVWLY